MSLSHFLVKAKPEVQIAAIVSATVVSVVAILNGRSDIALWWVISLTPIGVLTSVMNSSALKQLMAHTSAAMPGRDESSSKADV